MTRRGAGGVSPVLFWAGILGSSFSILPNGMRHQVDSTFATTHWSVVLQAGQGESSLAMAALEKLCSTYWYPLYAYVRRRGYAEHDAQDLTQGFFAHLVQHQVVRAAAPAQGKFRSFLLASLVHFMSNEFHRRQAQKRGGGRPVISLDAQEAEHRYRLEPANLESPEKLFEQRWAITLLEAALARLEQDCIASGKGALFQQLRGLLVEGPRSRSYADIAAQVGMTESAVKQAAHRLRQRYQQAVRQEIAQTVSSPAEVEEELRYLWSVLCG